jgi:hypothetical protein
MTERIAELTHMKAGVEDRRKVFLAGALSASALLMLGHWIFRPESSAAASSVSSATTAAPSARPARKIKANGPDSLDPTLHLARLELTEHEVYEGSGRNIFRSYGEDQPEKTRLAPKPEPTRPAEIPQAVEAPALRLRFFGIASTSESARKVCLTQDGDIFIGAEGDIVDRRYKILQIGSNTVELEDLLENRQYRLALGH